MKGLILLGKRIFEGQRFGKLVAIKYDNLYHKPPVWKCKCDCGKITYVRTALLNNGQVTSCGCSRIKKGNLSKNPYYKAFKQYNYTHKKKFSTIEDYINYRKEKDYLNKIKPTSKVKSWWKQIEKDQNGDFENLEEFSKWCEEKHYNKDCFIMRKKHKTKPYSKKNLQFGIYYEYHFISAYKFKIYNFGFDNNKKLFYGYIKFKGNTVLTDRYEDFNEFILNYCILYRRYFSKDFSFT